MFGTRIKHGLLSVSAVLLLAAAPASSWATCTPSYVRYVSGNWISTSSGTPTTVLAVAANFVNKLTSWLESDFVLSVTDTSNVYEICSDSTGNLESQITNKTLTPSMLFGADYSGANGNYTDSGTYYMYAKGYPMLMGYSTGNNYQGTAVTYTISSLSNLISELSGSAHSAEISDNLYLSYTLSSTLTSISSTSYYGVVVADPDLAPYGAAAINILNNLKNGFAITYNPSDVDSSEPNYPTSWLTPLDATAYNSITKAFNAIGIHAYAGFGAYAQICDSIPSNAYYVKFTGDTTDHQNHFMTHQWLGYIAANDSNGTGLGSKIYDHLVAEIGSGTWNSFITTNSCYGAVSTTQNGTNGDSNYVTP